MARLTSHGNRMLAKYERTREGSEHWIENRLTLALRSDMKVLRKREWRATDGSIAGHWRGGSYAIARDLTPDMTLNRFTRMCELIGMRPTKDSPEAK